ncbi:MAG: hypothetical protein M3M95_06150, partial [Pseudomonadota bacterium]|nr:hypothetical protein [Pseudomonadota bacterium]
MGDPDPYRILLVAEPSEAHRLKQRLSGARGPFTIEELEERELGSSAAPARLADRRTDLILIGETVVNPLAAAQKARTSTPGQVLFLVPRERLGRFRAGLPFVPNLASAWTADADGEDLELGELVTEAARGARERAAVATAF